MNRKHQEFKDHLAHADWGITVREILGLKSFASLKLIGGKKGIDNIVSGITVMEVPDFHHWVKEGELLLTTAFAISHNLLALHELIPTLSKKGLAGLALKPGRYLDKIPEDMIQLADAYHFPLITIGYETSFGDIIMPVSQIILEKQADYFKLSEEIHSNLMNAIFEADGVVSLAHKLYALVGNPLSIEVPMLNTCVQVPGGKEREPQLEEKPQACSIRDEGLTEKDSYEKNNIHAVDFPIIAGTEELGVIHVWERAPLSRLSITALERSISIAAFEIMRNLAISGAELKYKNIILDQLTSFSGDSIKQVKMRAKLFGWHLEPPYGVMVLQFQNEPQPNKQTISGYLDIRYHKAQQIIKQLNPNLLMAEKSDFLVIILSQVDRDALTYKKKVHHIYQALNASLKNDVPQMGVGRAYDRDSGLALSYEEACKALQIGKKFAARRPVTFFDELGVWRLISQMRNGKEAGDIIEEKIGPLIKYDQAHKTLFMETLRIFLACSGSIPETAKRLFVHYNTVTYRLSRIEEIGKIDLSNKEERFALEVVIKLVELKE
ncbi:PucR family transcriptional regulator [Candidatus Formimonas warabiya]|uniref:PucR family transcriptional regulator n=1 Tax=Formimonas warabiya TaxID=1761012 RepID=A0A3G1KZW6_FORW1|nr:PucR family transcriptional regulator [Candidatus Formimonas warabiya]ATW27775.1 hypothetical protein DCMF_26180 [Candidatus Formimonas warabiya]